MAGKGKGALRIAIEDFLETFALGKILSSWFTEVGEDQEQAIIKTSYDVMNVIKDVPEMPNVLKKLANYQEGDDLQGGLLAAGGLATGMGSAAASGFMQPIINKLNQLMEKGSRSQLVDIQTLIAMDRFGLVPEGDFEEVSQRLGWPDTSIEAWKQITKSRIGGSDLLNLWLRKEIGDTEFETELNKRGWDTEGIEKIKKLSQVIPGIGDLINMSVKEAFNPSVVSKFGYDQEFPEEVAQWAEKQGLSRMWAEYFWFAHWMTPSVGQGFEMLHRLRPKVSDNPFEEADMRELLKILDVPVYWRDRLIEISYNPLTRVDVRRMHDTGQLDADGVLNSYLDAGYNQENAQLMTDFTIAFNQDEEKQLSRSVIERAFKRGLFTETEAVDLLVLSGYTEEKAQFLIGLVNFDILEKETDLQTDLIHDLYLAGENSKSQAHSQLNALNLPNTQIERLLKEWELEKSKKVRLPTEGELESWYKLDFINDVDYLNGLILRNYKEETADLYIRQADEDIAIAAQKKELDLLDAKEKMIREGSASEYRIKRADLDVQIAQEKSNIAELKLLAHDVEEEETLTQLKVNITYIQMLIKNLQLEKAQLKLEIEEEFKPEE